MNPHGEEPATVVAVVPPHRSRLVTALGRLGRLTQKELREILRDRRTVLTLVLMPVLLYPLLGVAFNQFYRSNLAAAASPAYKIGVDTEQDEQVLTHFLALGLRATTELQDKLYPGGLPANTAPKLEIGTFADLDDAVRASDVHVGIRVNLPARTAPGAGDQGPVQCYLLFREDSVVGMQALAYVERLCAAANAKVLQQRLDALGPDRLQKLGLPTRAEPVQTVRAPVRDPAMQTTVSLAALVPLILILMTITGAVYPAIDLTAGERERGTLEVLVAAPIPRLSLLIAKYIAVVVVALLTALVNLGAMTVTMWLSGIGQQIFGPDGLSLLSIVLVLGLLVLFAAFFSAVLLILTSFARSFKEAQAYLVPLMLASLVPGMLGILPDLTLSVPVSVVPLLNIVLLARDLFRGTASPLLAGCVVLSTLGYALIALTVASQIFGASGVLYGEQGRWRHWLRRAPRQP